MGGACGPTVPWQIREFDASDPVEINRDLVNAFRLVGNWLKGAGSDEFLCELPLAPAGGSDATADYLLAAADSGSRSEDIRVLLS